ncbi:hypothetical protein MKEN_00967900 [Mycena kentingensis (nom. inval.)]|nr:hypothetical protein MKEN_00967900 [Mycena kentingensis (nom. inval.)]
MTVILTSLIAGRLLFMRRRLRRLMGPDTRTPYVTLSAMLVESATLYSVNGLVFLISYGVNSPVQNLFLPLLGQTQSIAPLLIILRVARGYAWNGDTTNQFSSVRFAGKSNSRPTAFQGGSTTILEELRNRSKPESQGDVELHVVEPKADSTLQDDETIEFRVKPSRAISVV